MTELKGDGEVFNDFYTNKKAPKQTPKIPESDTPEGARSNVSDAQSGRKDTPEFSVVQGEGEKTTENSEPMNEPRGSQYADNNSAGESRSRNEESSPRDYDAELKDLYRRGLRC